MRHKIDKLGLSIAWGSSYIERVGKKLRATHCNLWAPKWPNQWKGLVITPHLWGATASGVDYLAQPLLAQFNERIPVNFGDVILLGNEPDINIGRETIPDPSWGLQATMTPLQMAALYKQARELYPLAKFTTPQVSHLDYKKKRPFPWLSAWYKHLKSSGVKMPEYIGIHTYLRESPEAIVRAHQALSAKYGGPRKYIVSEWARFTRAGIAESLTFFHNDPDCHRHYYYTPFPGPDGQFSETALLKRPQGPMTQLGRQWQSTLYQLEPYPLS